MHQPSISRDGKFIAFEYKSNIYQVPSGTLLENHQLEPDIKMINEYNAVLNGRDQQLETAVKEMLKAI